MFGEAELDGVLRHPRSETHHLQCDVSCFRGNTLHGLVGAAASAAVEDHAGWEVHVLRVLGILREDVDEQFTGLTHAIVDDLHERDDLIFALVHSFVNAGSLYSG